MNPLHNISPEYIKGLTLITDIRDLLPDMGRAVSINISRANVEVRFSISTLLYEPNKWYAAIIDDHYADEIVTSVADEDIVKVLDSLYVRMEEYISNNPDYAHEEEEEEPEDPY